MGDASASHALGQPSCVGLAMRSMCRPRNRINFYPAAPFRLATMLNAWIITERKDGANLAVGTLAKRTWSRTCDPPTLPARGKMSVCVTDGRRPIQADAILSGGLSMFLRRPVNSDSSQPSCRRLRFGFNAHEMTIGPHVIRGMSAQRRSRPWQ